MGRMDVDDVKHRLSSAIYGVCWKCKRHYASTLALCLLGGKMATYENMRANPARSIGFNAVDAAAKIKVPALFVVAEKEELSNNAVVEQVHKEIQKRGVPSAYHIIKDITHYGIYREGFAEATKLEIEWFDKHFNGAK